MSYGTGISAARFVAKYPTSAQIWECWEIRTGRSDGYATYSSRIHFGERYMHRIAAAAMWGPIPEGFEVDHMCRNRCCANPFHLRVVPLAENRPGGARKDRCPRGHPYSGANLYVAPKGHRHCRECMRAANRAAHHAKKEQRNAERAARRARAQPSP